MIILSWDGGVQVGYYCQVLAGATEVKAWVSHFHSVMKKLLLYFETQFIFPHIIVDD